MWATLRLTSIGVRCSASSPMCASPQSSCEIASRKSPRSSASRPSWPCSIAEVCGRRPGFAVPPCTTVRRSRDRLAASPRRRASRRFGHADRGHRCVRLPWPERGGPPRSGARSGVLCLAGTAPWPRGSCAYDGGRITSSRVISGLEVLDDADHGVLSAGTIGDTGSDPPGDDRSGEGGAAPHADIRRGSRRHLASLVGVRPCHRECPPGCRR